MRCAAFLVLLPLATMTHARPVAPANFSDLDRVPAFAVCTVEQLTQREEVPPAERRLIGNEHRIEAVLLVRRAFVIPGVRALIPGDRIQASYHAPEPRSLILNGQEFVQLEKGQTALLALHHDGNFWTITRDQEWNPVMPALVSRPVLAAPSRSGRAFVFAELAHVLSHGETWQREQTARTLARFVGRVPDEFPDALVRAMGRNNKRWLEAGCTFLTVLGMSAKQTTLGIAEPSPPFQNLQELALWMVARGDRSDDQTNLIRCLLRHAGSYAWGTAKALADLKDSPIVIDNLKAELRSDVPGSVTITSLLVEAGQTATLPEGLEAAQRHILRSTTVNGDLPSAVRLILNHGSRTQFEFLVERLKRLKQEDEDAYCKLWNLVCRGESRRELRLAEVLIDDKRPALNPAQRYCDIAASHVQTISGEHFGISPQMSLQDRDKAVARAAKWLKEHREVL